MSLDDAFWAMDEQIAALRRIVQELREARLELAKDNEEAERRHADIPR